MKHNMKFTNLFPELILYISDYLYPIDIASLRITNSKYNYLKMDKNFENILLKKLEEYTDNPKKFLQYFNDSKASLSGSFILTCLGDFNFIEDDMDIFENIDEYETVHYYDNMDHTKLKFIKFICNIFGYEYINHNNKYLGMTNMIRYYKRGNKLINSINVPFIKHFDYIMNLFDTDICKNLYYNGKLYVKDWLNYIK